MSSLQKYKTKIFVLILLVCAICVGIVWLNASASKLQYEINTVNNKIQETSWQIRSTEAKVSIQSNIASLEEKAGAIWPYTDLISCFNARASGDCDALVIDSVVSGYYL